MLNTSRALLLFGLLGSSLAHAMDYRIETVTEGLEHPWSLAFLPDGRMLVTERVGRLRIIEADGSLNPQPVGGVPEGFVAAQAGLMEVILDPEFASNQQLYLSYAYGTTQANNTRLSKARLVDGQLQDVQVLFTAQPAKSGAAHYGGRMAWLPDNTLVLTLGDGFDWREQAQNTSNHLGKIVRLNRDGSAPKDNPLVGQAGAAAEIYSLGHRNVQGIVYDNQLQRLYSHEHGPRGGDELNLIEPGNNYGWPLITYGIDYTGDSVVFGLASKGVGAGATMKSKGLYTCIFSDACNTHRIAFFVAPTSAKLQGDGNVHRFHYGLQNIGDQLLVFQ